MNGLKAFWHEPRPAAAPPAGRWDVVLALVVAGAAIAEAFGREGLIWRPAVLASGFGIAALVLWRRRQPLLCVLLSFGAGHFAGAAALLTGTKYVDPYGGGFVLVLIYALFRWGSGREASAGFGFVYGVYALSMTLGHARPAAEVVGGAVVLSLPAALGLALRFWAKAHERALDEVRYKERENLARELHDSVAHHMAAIAIQAQAGQAVAAKNPELAVQALAAIEESASQTLHDMRGIVAALRDNDPAESQAGAGAARRPARGLRDIEGLAEGLFVPLSVSVDVEAGGVGPALDAALFRLAQESVTNAVKHGRGLSKIEVSVSRRDGVVRLSVTNDGAPAVHSPGGFGLVGMAERVALLGGTFEAGPLPRGGWAVEASLPHEEKRP